jgi:hypothetical protein
MQAHSYDAAATEAANALETGASGVNGTDAITGQDSMGQKTAVRTGVSTSSGGSILALRQAVEERARRARRMR